MNLNKLSCKYKTVLVAITILLCIICFSGCSGIKNTPNEQRLLNDYNEENTHIQYTEVEILRSQLYKEQKRFVVEAKYTGKDSFANYEAVVKLDYNFYDDAGWMKEDYTIEDYSENCYRGRTKEEVEEDIINNLEIYIENCTEIQVVAPGGITNSNTQEIVVNYKTKKGNVKGTYTDGIIEFVYKFGEWKFVEFKKGVASNYYLDLVGTRWIKEGSNDNHWKDIIITAVSEDSKYIEFEYGGEKCKASLSDEYRKFEGSHVGYLPENKLFLGESAKYFVGGKKYNVYLQDVRFPTFSGGGNKSIILEGLLEGYNGYDPTITIYYKLEK